MKVGDLVRAPFLMDHDGSVGIVVCLSTQQVAEVLFTNGVSKHVFLHLLDVLDESR